MNGWIVLAAVVIWVAWLAFIIWAIVSVVHALQH